MCNKIRQCNKQHNVCVCSCIYVDTFIVDYDDFEANYVTALCLVFFLTEIAAHICSSRLEHIQNTWRYVLTNVLNSLVSAMKILGHTTVFFRFNEFMKRFIFHAGKMDYVWKIVFIHCHSCKLLLVRSSLLPALMSIAIAVLLFIQLNFFAYKARCIIWLLEEISFYSGLAHLLSVEDKDLLFNDPSRQANRWKSFLYTWSVHYFK